ncbi:Uncharacterised protein [Vibrio cholerae]|nr:Uncharacterised protein [Vibrio cholerae]
MADARTRALSLTAALSQQGSCSCLSYLKVSPTLFPKVNPNAHPTLCGPFVATTLAGLKNH